MAAATATEIAVVQTGIVNGKLNSLGEVDNSSYYVQWAYGLGRLELIDSNGQIAASMDLLPVTVAALAQAGLAAAPYTTYPVGKTVLVTDWNATGFGVIIQKFADVANTFADWKVVSTGTKASTGDVGANPI